MKKILSIIFIIICLSFMPAISAQNGTEPSWQKLDENSYINTDGIMGLEDIYGYSFLLKAYNKGQYEPIYGKSIKYTLGQYTIDCARKKYKIGIIDSYGENNNFINGDYNKYAAFQPIIQGTAVSEAAKMLCKQ